MTCESCTWSEQCAQEVICEYYDPLAIEESDNWRRDEFYETWYEYADFDGDYF